MNFIGRRITRLKIKESAAVYRQTLSSRSVHDYGPQRQPVIAVDVKVDCQRTG